MSKHHNYSQYANKNSDTTPVEETAEVEVQEQADVVETVETVEDFATLKETPVVAEPVEESEPQTVDPMAVGEVVNCSKLNVRSAANAQADPVCVLDVNAEVKIYVDGSTDQFYHVCTATGVEGYCMRQFIKVRA